MSRFSRQYWVINISQNYRHARLVTRTTYYFFAIKTIRSQIKVIARKLAAKVGHLALTYILRYFCRAQNFHRNSIKFDGKSLLALQFTKHALKHNSADCLGMRSKLSHHWGIIVYIPLTGIGARGSVVH
jgi:hypothetical protein